MNNQESESALEMDDSCLSFGLRESIASYLSLAGEDNSSFRDNRKKKTQSLIYTGNKRKNNFHFPTLFYDD